MTREAAASFEVAVRTFLAGGGDAADASLAELPHAAGESVTVHTVGAFLASAGPDAGSALSVRGTPNFTDIRVDPGEVRVLRHRRRQSPLC